MSSLQVFKTFDPYRVRANVSCLVEACPLDNTATADVRGEFSEQGMCCDVKSVPPDLDFPTTAQDF